MIPAIPPSRVLVPSPVPAPPADAQTFLHATEKNANLYKFDDVEDTVDKFTKDFTMQLETHRQFATLRDEALEEIAVLSSGLLNDQSESGGLVSTICGVVDTEQRAQLERSLFRATYGNVYTHFQDIRAGDFGGADVLSMGPKRRSVFVVYFQDRMWGDPSNLFGGVPVVTGVPLGGGMRGSSSSSSRGSRSGRDVPLLLCCNKVKLELWGAAP